MKEIYLAGGCFWGVEAYFQAVKGVVETNVGYANGDISNPKYEDLKQHRATHAETVRIRYDENITNLNKILDHFFYIIDPYSVNKQGNDYGLQYRSGIFYTNDEDKKAIMDYLSKIPDSKNFKVLIEKLNNYYEAEEYHQSYLKKNPHGYCHIDLNNMKKD